VDPSTGDLVTETRSAGAHRLSWIDPAPSAPSDEVVGTVDPYEQARVAVTVGGAGIRVVRVTGELSSSSAAVLRDVLEHLIDARLAGLVIDLSAASFIGVRGITALVCAADRARRRALALSVVLGEHTEVTRVLTRVRREDALPVDVPLIARLPEPAPGRALTIAVHHRADHAVVVLGGELTKAGVGAITRALTTPLLGDGRVIADLTHLRVGWIPALQVFPSILAAAGGWPAARLVLFGASPEVSEALRAIDVPDTVPLAADRAAALARLDSRPDAVCRYHVLEPHLGSPRRARALFRRACLEWALGSSYDDAALVVNELVMNSVRHAGTPCRLDIRLDGRGLRVAARDDGPVTPALLGSVDHPPPCGTGLHLVATLSCRWGVEQHVDGKTVWARLTPRRGLSGACPAK
jgi:anti-anti-sigma factor